MVVKTKSNMELTARYEILPGLPGSGPMYIPVSDNNEQFYSEGFVVRFFKTDGTNWIANFKPGWSDFNFVKEYPDSNRIMIIAQGQGYIMEPDSLEPLKTFGLRIKEVIEAKNNKIICADDCSLYLIDEKGGVWQSERISWDGIKELTIQQNTVAGLSYYPMNDSWVPFTFDIDTKLITGASF